MEPLLPAGSRVIAALYQPGAPLRVGDVVLARRPDRPQVEMVKRIEALDGDRVVLVGDNPAESTDSLVFGPVGRSAVIAVIRWRYWPMPPRRL
jgi:type IV secretory pathway protease TraF